MESRRFPAFTLSAHANPSTKANDRPARRPHAHLQEYLNLTEHLYGLVTNGKLLVAPATPRGSSNSPYVEFDLDRSSVEELFADFAVLIGCFHVTRRRARRRSLPSRCSNVIIRTRSNPGARIRDGLSFAG